MTTPFVDGEDVESLKKPFQVALAPLKGMGPAGYDEQGKYVHRFKDPESGDITDRRIGTYGYAHPGSFFPFFLNKEVRKLTSFAINKSNYLVAGLGPKAGDKIDLDQVTPEGKFIGYGKAQPRKLSENSGAPNWTEHFGAANCDPAKIGKATNLIGANYCNRSFWHLMLGGHDDFVSKYLQDLGTHGLRMLMGEWKLLRNVIGDGYSYQEDPEVPRIDNDKLVKGWGN